LLTPVVLRQCHNRRSKKGKEGKNGKNSGIFAIFALFASFASSLHSCERSSLPFDIQALAVGIGYATLENHLPAVRSANITYREGV
jgi:hypothetical protein